MFRAWLVEDDQTDVALIEAHLGEVELTERVATLHEAVRLLASPQPRPDVVLVDLDLPDSTGLATLERLLDVAHRLPVVVLSGDQEAAAVAVQLGASDSLPKHRLDDLARVVRNAIHRHRRAGLTGRQMTTRFLDLDLDLLLVLDRNDEPVQVNATFTALMGYGLTELQVRGWRNLVLPEDLPRTLAAMEQVREGFNLITVEHRMQAADGVMAWLQWRFAMDEATGLLYGVARDISELMLEQEDLRRQVRIDPLTGLANRLGLIEHMDRCISEDRQFTLLFCDLDDFEGLNDTYGHAVGDHLLQVVADRLAPLLRRSDDLVARYRGDEYIVVADRTPARRAASLVKRVLELINEPIEVAGTEVSLTACVGLVERSTLLTDINSLLSAADRALLVAKRAGRNQVRRWGPTLEEQDIDLLDV